MLNLTDKLPKPTYDDIEVNIDEKKFTYRAASQSPKLGDSRELSNNGSLKQRKRKARELSKISNGSKVSETAEGSELPSVRSKASPIIRPKKNHNSSVERLPEVVKPSNKMASIERIASRIEQEIKKKPLMNIDKEYSNLQKILDKQKVYEKEIANVNFILRFCYRNK
jgi:hypothetical protein